MARKNKKQMHKTIILSLSHHTSCHLPYHSSTFLQGSDSISVFSISAPLLFFSAIQTECHLPCCLQRESSEPLVTLWFVRRRHFQVHVCHPDSLRPPLCLDPLPSTNSGIQSTAKLAAMNRSGVPGPSMSYDAKATKIYTSSGTSSTRNETCFWQSSSSQGAAKLSIHNLIGWKKFRRVWAQSNKSWASASVERYPNIIQNWNKNCWQAWKKKTKWMTFSSWSVGKRGRRELNEWPSLVWMPSSYKMRLSSSIRVFL